MKKYLILIIILSLLGLPSCIKQKNCDCESLLFGNFLYYETPKEFSYCGKTKIVNAVFIHDIPDFPFITEKNIVGSIPKDFQVKDTVKVSVCLELERSGNCVILGEGAIYSITCIEKEK